MHKFTHASLCHWSLNAVYVHGQHQTAMTCSDLRVKVNAEQSNVRYHLNMDRDASATLRETHAVINNTEYFYYLVHPSTHPLFTTSYHVCAHDAESLT